MYAENDQGQVVITLSFGEFEWLYMALGDVVGSAMLRGDRPLSDMYARLTNEVNRGNQRFIPHQVGSDDQK